MGKTHLTTLLCVTAITLTGCTTGHVTIPFTHVGQNTDTFTTTEKTTAPTVDETPGEDRGNNLISDAQEKIKEGENALSGTVSTTAPTGDANIRGNTGGIQESENMDTPANHTPPDDDTPTHPDGRPVFRQNPQKPMTRDEAVGIAAWRAGVSDENIAITKAEKNQRGQWVVKLKKNNITWTVYVNSTSGNIDQYGKLVR